MQDIVIYHNPRCSKSRQTLALLQERGIEPRVVLYLQTPPSKAELKALIGMLGVKPAQLIRFGETVAKEKGLSARDERSDEAWLDLMIDNPVLIERPIVTDGSKAVLGRPPENVLAMLGG